MRKKQLIILAACLVPVMLIGLTPKARVAEAESIDIARGLRLMLRSPFTKVKEDIDIDSDLIYVPVGLYKNEGGEYLEIEFGKSMFSEVTVGGQWFGGHRPAGEYRRIAYGRPRDSNAGTRCMKSVSIEPADAEKTVSQLLLYQSSRLPGERVFDMAADGALLVVIEQGPGCSYWLRAHSKSGEGNNLSVELSMPFRHEIVLNTGSVVSFRFLSLGESGSDWSVGLFPEEALRSRKTEIEVADDGAWSLHPLLRAHAARNGKIAGVGVKLDKLQVLSSGMWTVEGSLIKDGSRLTFLKFHVVWSMTLFFLIVAVALGVCIWIGVVGMEKCRILFLAANPAAGRRLQLDEEFRDITETIEASMYRDRFEMKIRPALRLKDLLKVLLEYRPHIVHFSGHGAQDEKIILVDRNGQLAPLGKEVIVDLFSALKDDIKIVVLNACYSRPQAEAITEVIDCAVGMAGPIGDKAAIAFADAFYLTIGSGRSVKEAFALGRVAVAALDISEKETPELLVREDVDASKIRLVRDRRGEEETEAVGEERAEPVGEEQSESSRESHYLEKLTEKRDYYKEELLKAGPRQKWALKEDLREIEAMIQKEQERR